MNNEEDETTSSQLTRVISESDKEIDKVIEEVNRRMSSAIAKVLAINPQIGEDYGDYVLAGTTESHGVTLEEQRAAAARREELDRKYPQNSTLDNPDGHALGVFWTKLKVNDRSGLLTKHALLAISQKST